jgi:AcrR family transcriptional regulator
MGGRRPRDRRQQILAAAAERFRASGYHNVGMTEIADAVGVTGPAMYRHFRGKQDLLLATLRDAFDHFATVCARDYADLDELLAAATTMSLQRRDIGVLWEREAAHLPDDLRHELRDQFLAAAEPVRSAIGRARLDLRPDAVDLLLWAVLGVCVSVGYHAVKLDPNRFRARLVQAAWAVCAITPAAVGNRDDAVAASRGLTGRLLPASRREAILTAATRLFGVHGYQAVGVDDIGAAAGITGATVYRHFASKPAILAAALNRCLEAMFFDLATVFDVASGPADALDLLLRFFVRTSIEHGEVIGALLNEITSLPAEDRQKLRRARHDYLAEWVALLVGNRPDLTDAEAQVLVHATVAVIHSLPRIPHLRHRPALDRDLVALGRAVLGMDLGARYT